MSQKNYDELQEQFEFVLDRLHPENFNKKYDKGNRKNLLHIHAGTIYRWILTRGNQQRDNMDKLVKLLGNVKVAKTIRSLIKDYRNDDHFEDNPEEVQIGVEFVVVINEVLTKLDQKEESYLIYYDIANELISNRVNKMVKRVGVNEEVARNLLLIVPTPDVITRDNVVGVFTNKVARRLYSFAYMKHDGLPTTTEEIENILLFLFGKHYMNEVITSLALERRQAHKNSNETYNELQTLMSTLVVNYINGQKKDVIKEMLLRYADRRIHDRKQKRDAARRLQINALSKEDYKKIIKVAEKLKADPRVAEVL